MLMTFEESPKNVKVRLETSAPCLLLDMPTFLGWMARESNAFHARIEKFESDRRDDDWKRIGKHFPLFERQSTANWNR